MKKRILICSATVAAVILLAILFISAGNQRNGLIDKSFVGIWEIDSGTYVDSVEIRENGTYEYRRPSGEKLDYGTYEVISYDKTSINIAMSSEVTGLIAQFKVFDNVMINLTYIIDLRRYGFEEGLYGEWMHPNYNDTWIINEDGTISSALQIYRYKMNGDVYQAEFIESDNTCPILFEYDGENVTLYVGAVYEKRT